MVLVLDSHLKTALNIMTIFVGEFFQNLMKKKKERGLLVHSIFLIMFTCGLCQKYFVEIAVEIAVHTEVIEVSLQTSSKIIILKFLSRKMDPQIYSYCTLLSSSLFY